MASTARASAGHVLPCTRALFWIVRLLGQVALCSDIAQPPSTVWLCQLFSTRMSCTGPMVPHYVHDTLHEYWLRARESEQIPPWKYTASCYWDARILLDSQLSSSHVPEDKATLVHRRRRCDECESNLIELCESVSSALPRLCARLIIMRHTGT